jgi:hypothetical protein
VLADNICARLDDEGREGVRLLLLQNQHPGGHFFAGGLDSAEWYSAESLLKAVAGVLKVDGSLSRSGMWA